MTFSKRATVLIIMLVVASLLRLYDLPHGDPMSDEVLYGFRSIGYLDFDFAIAQPTPLQLFEDHIPAWTKLSFHDHPPLVFLVQHWFMKLFGPNLWGLRLSSALFGIGAVYLVYVIGRKLFTETAGLLSAALVSVTILAVYPSRVAIQESQVILFMLLTVYAFLKAQEHSRWYAVTGLAFGAALLSKYTAGILVLPLVAYVILYNRAALKDGWAWFGSILAFVIFSPVIVYNAMLYRTFGHFDFQLFYIFKQQVPYWQDTPGKEIGTVMERIVGVPKNIFLYGSLGSTIAGAVSVIWLFVITCLKKRQRSHVLVALMFCGFFVLYLAIGPSPRFLTLMIPWLALVVGTAVASLIASFPKFKTALYSAFTILCVIEALITVNTTFLDAPIGSESLHYSKIHYDMKSWGYNSLDAYLEQRTAGRYSELIVPYRYQFLEDIKNGAVADAKERGLTPERTLFIFNENMSDLATLWVILRRSLYQAWPMIGASNYRETLQEQGAEFYRDAGFVSFVFIQNSDSVLKNYEYRLTDDGDQLETELRDASVAPEIIYGPSGAEAFRIYTFE